jgi:hypothetical protein
MTKDIDLAIQKLQISEDVIKGVLSHNSVHFR